MTSIDRRALIIMLLMTAANGGSDTKNDNGDDVFTRRRRQMMSRERSGDSSRGGGDTAPTTRGLSSHATTRRDDDGDCCTTSATNAPDATSLISSLLGYDLENMQIANVSTSSHACYELFSVANNDDGERRRQRRQRSTTTTNVANDNVDDDNSALILPREGGIIMSTGRPDSFCNVNVNNRQSTNWGKVGDDDLGAIVNANNHSMMTKTTITTVQQQLTTIPTHDAVRIIIPSAPPCVRVCI